MQEGNAVIWGVLQIAEERREAKSNRERERCAQLNAEFQRVTGRDKKAFFNEQCKEIEENNRKGEATDLFKKTGNNKGTFPPKMGAVKDRNSTDLMEAEEIKKKWKEHTEELYNEGLNDTNNYSGVVSHLEPDSLECGVGLRKYCCQYS